MSRKSQTVLLATLALLAALFVPASAGARKQAVGPARHLAAKPAKTEIGRATLAAPHNAPGALLVSVHYPVQMIGRPVDLRVALHGVPGKGRRVWNLHVIADAGRQRRPERRRQFTFVHRIDLGPALTRRLRAGLRPGSVSLTVTATGALDANGDGKPEVSTSDRERQPLHLAGARQCADVPRLRTVPGKAVATRLPVCGARVHWRIVKRPRGGVAKIRKGKLIYRPPAEGSGTEPILLEAPAPKPAAAPEEPRQEEPAKTEEAPAKSPATPEEQPAAEQPAEAEKPTRQAEEPLTTPVQVTVAPEEPVRVRAIGDSVTAGFGYYSDGSLMPFYDLLECRPGEPYDDACSSNSTVTNNEVQEVEYAPDYGLSNNVSWAAQWANDNGVTDYENLAVSGSEPKNWVEGGVLYPTLEKVEAEKPDYLLMTIGANPILSNTLFGLEDMGCGLITDLFGEFSECVEAAFDEVFLSVYLQDLYEELLENTPTTTQIYVMQYHLSIPSISLAYTATQIATMVKLLNEEIEKAVAAAKVEEPNPERLQTFAPPHFNTGVDIEPTYPDNYKCHWFFSVDGPSVQSGPTQTLLAGLHPFSFCGGPGNENEGPWVISGDTGIHPSATGYSHMESVLPPLE